MPLSPEEAATAGDIADIALMINSAVRQGDGALWSLTDIPPDVMKIVAGAFADSLNAGPLLAELAATDSGTARALIRDWTRAVFAQAFAAGYTHGKRSASTGER